MIKYRTISDGQVNFLQYLHEYKIFFVKIKKWKYIWKPYYDIATGREYDMFGYKGFINSKNENLENFVNRWNDINEYFKWAKIEQKRLEKIASDYKKERNKNKGKIEYF